MSYMRLTQHYKRILAFGFLMSFFSGFGQSFFISTFTLSFIEAFSITNATFGVIYASATLCSGLLLPYLGGLLDRTRTVVYVYAAVLGLAASCFIVAVSPKFSILAIGIFGLRLFGQGLFSHVSATVIARSFSVYRGRALSLSSLGYPVSEGILPLLSVTLISILGWRGAWGVFGLLLLMSLLPVISHLISGKTEAGEGKTLREPIMERMSSRKTPIPSFVKTFQFWFYAIGTMIPPLVLTALFLYHGQIAEKHGWTLTWMASSFVSFAVARLFFSLLGGPWIDRLGAIRLFPLYLVPLALGLFILSFQGLWVAPTYLALAGVTMGLGEPLKTALWTEMYGTRNIAKVRSRTSALAVLSTAAGPPMLGVAFDANISLEGILWTSAFVILAYSLLSSFSKVSKKNLDA